MPRGNQRAPQWQLLQLVDHPAGIAVEDAARKLDCTVRTIWRRLQLLQNLSHTHASKIPSLKQPHVSGLTRNRSSTCPVAAHALLTVFGQDVEILLRLN